ncbi:MAG: heparinase II/III family protein [Planctomycetaceae bacterium]|jgi:hypothetical protein|nr:heparinase II/III family protein [Planctomycetaceae bacterium]
MKLHYSWTFLFFLFSVSALFSDEKPYFVPIPAAEEILKTLRPEHPRLFVLAETEERIKKLIAENTEAENLYKTLLENGQKILTEEPVVYEIKVRSQPTILDTSRKAKDRIILLSTLYRLTKEKKYLDRAVLEMTTVCRFNDWNHRCFLDTAEMLLGVAVGYDWLYADLTSEQRILFRESIRNKGLVPGKEAYEKKVGWTKTRFNWNQVCSGGLTVGALAVADEEPQLAAWLLNKAATGVQTAMDEFQPDGGTREGAGYWSYAVQYNVMMIAALQSALGTDFGLSGFPGFDQTGRFRIHFVTPLKTVFTFGDGGSTTNSNPVMFWFATQFNRPDYAGHDRMWFTPNKPFHLWWFNESKDFGNEPTSAHFQHAGLAFMRSSWEPNAVYVAVKGGSTATGHSHMELGHFQLIANERLWLSDLGSVSYTKDYFHKEKRWTFYRATNFAHNVPVIDGKLQNPIGSAPITKFETTKNRTMLEVDLTDAYKGQVASANRRITLENQIVTIEDIFSGVKGEQFLWQVHAPVRRVVVNATNPHRVDMQHFSKRMRLELVEPKNATFNTEEIIVPEDQPPVKNTTRIAVRLKVDSQPIHVKVRLIPEMK